MNKPLDGFDDFDPETEAGLTCHIELETSGWQTPRQASVHIAEVLRNLADQIEAGARDTGHHAVTSGDGKALGELYLDYYGEG